MSVDCNKVPGLTRLNLEPEMSIEVQEEAPQEIQAMQKLLLCQVQACSTPCRWEQEKSIQSVRHDIQNQPVDPQLIYCFKKLFKIHRLAYITVRTTLIASHDITLLARGS